MRYFLFLLLIPSFAGAQLAEKDFVVNVELISFDKTEKFYLEYKNSNDYDKPEITDSLLPSSGKFSFKGKLTEPCIATLYRYIEYPKLILDMMKDMPGMDSATKELLKGPMEEYLNGPMPEPYIFFLVPGETTIIAKRSLLEPSITGAAETMDFARLKEAEKEFEYKNQKLYMELYRCGSDDTCKQKVEKDLEARKKEMKEKVYLSYFRDNPSSLLALHALREYIPSKIDEPDRYLELFSLLPPSTRGWSSAVSLKETLEASKKTAIGMPVSDFKQFDTLGKASQFSSYKGRYVLIDLWASWCIPCRRLHPDLLKTFEKYKGENFSILGIALEKEGDKQQWLKAIRTDKLAWTQVTDFKYWKNAVARQFGIRSIPFNVLVDPDGKIIDKDLHGLALDKKLAELFKR